MTQAVRRLAPPAPANLPVGSLGGNPAAHVPAHLAAHPAPHPAASPTVHAAALACLAAALGACAPAAPVLACLGCPRRAAGACSPCGGTPHSMCSRVEGLAGGMQSLDFQGGAVAAAPGAAGAAVADAEALCGDWAPPLSLTLSLGATLVEELLEAAAGAPAGARAEALAALRAVARGYGAALVGHWGQLCALAAAAVTLASSSEAAQDRRSHQGVCKNLRRCTLSLFHLRTKRRGSRRRQLATSECL